MNEQIRRFLSKIGDKQLERKYLKIILTLLEKGYFPGLAGIPAVKSRVSHIDGEKGVLSYRGYPVWELAEHCTYEDVCFLLLNEDLPLPEEKEGLRREFLSNKNIKESIAQSIVDFDEDLPPMNMLSAGMLLLQSNDKTALDVDFHKPNLHRSIRLIAKFPTLLGLFRTRDINFNKDKTFDSFVQYCLYCLNRDIYKDSMWVEIFEKLLILHADHTMNNSTFSARGVGSSKASIYSSVSSAINSLSGPLHGGANERVIYMLEEINGPENAEAYFKRKLEKGEKIMGIGHRVYKTYDPRARYLKENILPVIFNNSDIDVDPYLRELYDTAKELEKVALRTLASKKLFPNVDFWSGIVLKAMDIEPRFFTTIFALGRIMGWCAHWVEHMEKDNKIFRPIQLYEGFGLRHVLIEENDVS